ncbi:MAG: MFS transporter [Chloroflexota bacterium]
MPKILSILRHRQIFLLWFGRLLSAFGDRFFDVAVVWLSVQIVGSEAGFILAAGSISNFLAGLIGGVLADRWDRQKLMIGIDIIRATSILTLPLAAILGEITLLHLAIAAAIEGAMGSLFDPALQASLPQLISDQGELQAGNALLDVTMRISQIFAPGLAGFLIASIPAQHLFTIDAATFIISGLSLFAIGRGFNWRPKPATETNDGMTGVFQEIQGAIKLVNQHKPMLWAIVTYIPINVAWSASLMVGLALLAEGPLELGAEGYGLLFTAYGVGSVLSNIVVGSLTVNRRELLLFAGQVVLGCGIILIGFSSSFWLAALGALVAALGTPMSDLMMLFMIQSDFPENQVGKVFSLRFTISNIGYSAGLLLAAVLFQWLGIRPGLIFFGALSLLTGTVGFSRFSFDSLKSDS